VTSAVAPLHARGVYDFLAVGWVVRASSRAAEVGRSFVEAGGGE
jgi:hypothetical protein